MPSRWHFFLDAHPSKVQWHHLHGALSGFFHHRSDGSTDFALTPPELGPEGASRVELRILSDHRLVVDRLVKGLEDARAEGGLLLGPRDRQKRVKVLSAPGAVTIGPLSLSEATSWAELREMSAPVNVFTVHYVTPTFSRDGNRQLPLPMPAMIERGLQRHWAAHAPRLAPVLKRDDLELVIEHLDGRTVTVRLDDNPWTGFVGEVRYRVVRGGRDEKQALGQLLQAARFTGLGSMVAYGFGTVDVE